MRPANSTPPPRNSTGAAAAIDAGFGNWHSPIPYLFTGLAIVLGLIAIALLVLSCSYLHSPSDSDSSAAAIAAAADEEKQANGGRDSEATIVVIMAGDDNPTFFAKQTTL